MSLPSVSLFCLLGTEDIGKGDSLVKAKKPALCQQPQEVPWERCSGSSCAEEHFLPSVSRASSVAKKALSRSYKSEPFLGVINSTQQYSSPLTQNCKLTLWSLCVQAPMEVRARPLAAQGTTHSHQLSPQNTGNTLNICRMPALRLAEPCCSCRENNEVHE